MTQCQIIYFVKYPAAFYRFRRRFQIKVFFSDIALLSNWKTQVSGMVRLRPPCMKIVTLQTGSLFFYLSWPILNWATFLGWLDQWCENWFVPFNELELPGFFWNKIFELTWFGKTVETLDINFNAPKTKTLEAFWSMKIID